MTINVFFLEIVAHRGSAIDELVFDTIDRDLHHLPPPELTTRHGLEVEQPPLPSLLIEPRNCPRMLHWRSPGTNHSTCILTAPSLAALEKDHPDSGPAAHAVPHGQGCCFVTAAF